MTTDRHLDRLIEAYLEPGADRLPEPSYEAVRAATERTRQRVGLGPWPAPAIRLRGRHVLALAVVALLAAIAIGPGVGGAPTPTPTPSLPATPRPLPSNPSNPSSWERLEAGTYLTGFGNWPGYHQMRFTVPDGWYSEHGMVFNGPDDGVGATVVLEYRQFVDRVNIDACHRSGQLWEPTTAQQLTDALAHQPNMVVTVPRAVALGGTPATLVEISIPANFDAHTCDGLRLRFLGSAATDLHEFPGAAGHRFWFYVVGTDRPAIVVAHAFRNATAEDVAALQAVVDSIGFEP